MTNAIGDANSKSIGMTIVNNVMYGEGYGTARGITASLGNMSDVSWYQVKIDHQPAIPRIDYYVNIGAGFPSSPTASITTSANIPQSDDGAAYVCFSIEKGAVATDIGLRHSIVHIFSFN
jgi:hypothetical protein